jgi:hypothetical protein
MCDALQVRWTITPKTAPRPWIACSGCGGLKAFQSSNKIRLNANGRRLDAWLIYKCSDCDKTWNRPLFERRNVRDIDPSILEALQSNDAAWIRVETFNLEALRHKSQRVDEFPEFAITKEVLRETRGWTTLEIQLAVPLPTSMRLDRLLACELMLSRTRLQTLHDRGLLVIHSDRADSLRRRVKAGTVALLDLSAEADRVELWKPRATATAP